MASEFRFSFTASGPAEELDLLKKAVEGHAQKEEDGEYLARIGDEVFWLVPTWEGLFDNVPVRLWNGELVMWGYSRRRPPMEFFVGMSVQYPNLECHLKTTELTNMISEHIRAKRGAVDQLEYHVAHSYTGAICEWERGGMQWTWVGERQQDLAMLRRFLRVDASEAISAEELEDICEKAYDAMAFPESVCPAAASGHVYHIAETIIECQAQIKDGLTGAVHPNLKCIL